jgi:hypothetical protein
MEHVGVLTKSALRRPYLSLDPHARAEVAATVDEIVAASAALADR